MIKESEALKAIATFVSYCHENTCKIFSNDKTSYCPLEWFCLNRYDPWSFYSEDIERQLVDARIREEKDDGKMKLKCKECTEEKCIALERAEIDKGYLVKGCFKGENGMPELLIAVKEKSINPIILYKCEYEVKK